MPNSSRDATLIERGASSQRFRDFLDPEMAAEDFSPDEPLPPTGLTDVEDCARLSVVHRQREIIFDKRNIENLIINHIPIGNLRFHVSMDRRGLRKKKR